jgi:hypothetical protein
MATLTNRLSIQPRATPAVPTRRARRSRDEMTDREVGFVAAGVIAGLGLLIATMLVAIVIYSLSWGYAIEL